MDGFTEKLVDGKACFNKLKFLVGSGCRPVQINFTAQIQPIQNGRSAGKKIKIETDPTDGFVVITNIKQWAEAQGIVLKKEIFRGGDLVRYTPFLCNCLHKQYLHATQQGPKNCERSLLPEEFDFVVNKLKITDGQVSISDFDKFWAWLGSILQKIRYQKYLSAMWTKGLFWGFISKLQSEDILQKTEVGVFLLRFSERQGGSIAVAYKQSPVCVRHYLIKSNDARSLPQFLREAPSFLWFLRIRVGKHFQMELSLVVKDTALASMSKPSKSKEKTPEKAYYDTEIQELLRGESLAKLSF